MKDLNPTEKCAHQEREAAVWLQKDSAFLYAQARNYQLSIKHGSEFLAAQVQKSAAHSSVLARTATCAYNKQRSCYNVNVQLRSERK